jgi:hypothetical protein
MGVNIPETIFYLIIKLAMNRINAKPKHTEANNGAKLSLVALAAISTK